MLEVIVFVVLSFFVAVHDWKYKTLPHWLMLPLIVSAMVYNHDISHVGTAFVLLIMGLVMARHKDEYVDKNGIWVAGDAKLFMMYGAFFGIKSFIIFVCTVCVVYVINRKHVPVAPLSLPFVLMMLM